MVADVNYAEDVLERPEIMEVFKNVSFSLKPFEITIRKIQLLV